MYRQKLVDIARGAADGDKDSYFADLNEQWGAARRRSSRADASGPGRRTWHIAPPARAPAGAPAVHPTAVTCSAGSADDPRSRRCRGRRAPAARRSSDGAHAVAVPRRAAGPADRVHLLPRRSTCSGTASPTGTASTRTKSFVGLDNYVEVFTRPELFGVFVVSLYYVGASFVQIGLALYFATCCRFSVAVPEPVQGHPVLPVPHQRRRDRHSIFLYFFQPGGTLDTALALLGVRRLPQQWLGDPDIDQLLAGRHVGLALHGPELRAVPRRDPVDPRRAVRGRRDRRRQPVAAVPATSSARASGRVVGLSFILAISGSPVGVRDPVHHDRRRQRQRRRSSSRP